MLLLARLYLLMRLLKHLLLSTPTHLLRNHPCMQVNPSCRASLVDLGKRSGIDGLTTLMDNCNVTHIATTPTTTTANLPRTFCRLVSPGATNKVRRYLLQAVARGRHQAAAAVHCQLPPAPCQLCYGCC